MSNVRSFGNCGIPLTSEEQLRQQTLLTLNKLANQSSGGLANFTLCLKVIVAGTWGIEGDIIIQVVWLDTSSTLPTYSTTTYFNVRTQSFVNSINTVNTIFCDLAEQTKYALIEADTSGFTVIIPGVAGKVFAITDYVIIADGTVNTRWLSETTNVSGIAYFEAKSGVSSGHAPKGHFKTVMGEDLILELSTNTAVGGHLTYLEI